MIHATCRPDETRRSSRGTPWLSQTTIEGQTYQAESRSSPNTELCRVLVAAGIPDQPLTVTDANGHVVTYPSIHRAAKRTIGESASKEIRSVRWLPRPEGFE